MNYVGLQIPASLYTQLYQVHGEHTEHRILAALHRLRGEKPTPNISSSSSLRPREGTITGKVWAIADKFKAEKGNATREEVVRACIEENINMNTASTQFSHWNKENR